MDIDLLNYASNRINYRRFSDKIPDKKIIEKIVQEAFTISPIQNLRMEFKIDIFGPEYAKEKDDFVIFTVCENNWRKIAKETKSVNDLQKLQEFRDKNWKAKVYAGDFGVTHLGFNHQVKAPYLLRFTSKNKSGYINAGVYSFAASLVACKYKLDSSFCKCFVINKNFLNPITTARDDVLFYLGLGIYDDTLSKEFVEYKYNRKANFDINSFIKWR